MAERKRIMIDAGHGGVEPGAIYQGRQEKDDTLNMAFTVGYFLENAGMEVLYTRVNDTYDTPYEKANMANQAGVDYFLSIHRNAMPVPNTASGIQSLVYADTGVPGLMAHNINQQLVGVGFNDLGVIERPNLVVLNSTQMPSVLVEVGFIDSDQDNMLFDQRTNAIGEAIANGVLQTIDEVEANRPPYYQVQVGAYQNRNLAQQQSTRLQSQGFPAFVVYEDGYYKVRVGAFENLDNAVSMEQQLRNYGYNTFITRA